MTINASTSAVPQKPLTTIGGGSNKGSLTRPQENGPNTIDYSLDDHNAAELAEDLESHYVQANRLAGRG